MEKEFSKIEIETAALLLLICVRAGIKPSVFMDKFDRGKKTIDRIKKDIEESVEGIRFEKDQDGGGSTFLINDDDVPYNMVVDKSPRCTAKDKHQERLYRIYRNIDFFIDEISDLLLSTYPDEKEDRERISASAVKNEQWNQNVSKRTIERDVETIVKMMDALKEIGYPY